MHIKVRVAELQAQQRNLRKPTDAVRLIETKIEEDVCKQNECDEKENKLGNT